MRDSILGELQMQEIFNFSLISILIGNSNIIIVIEWLI